MSRGIALGDGEQVQQMMYNMGAVYEKRGDFGKALETFRSICIKVRFHAELEKRLPAFWRGVGGSVIFCTAPGLLGGSMAELIDLKSWRSAVILIAVNTSDKDNKTVPG